MSYIPPANNAINFDLRSYTKPAISSVNFELGGTIQTFGKVCISDVWKDITEVKVCVAQAWKNVIELQVVVGNAWKVGQ